MMLMLLFAAISAAGCNKERPSSMETKEKEAIGLAASPKVETKVAPKESHKLAEPTAHGAADEASLGTLPSDMGIPVGNKVQDFQVLDIKGEPVSLSELVLKGKILLFFYRGGW